MGSFLTNYQVRSNSPADVVRLLAPLVDRAYISPAKNGWVTVYEEKSDEQDERVLSRFAQMLSSKLGTSVFAFLVHDSDVLLYFLCENGREVDRYNSNPDYFQEADDDTRARVRGNAAVVLRHCVAGTKIEDLQALLHDPEVDVDLALQELASFLGMDPLRVGLGFKYFDEEHGEGLDDTAEFQFVGRSVTDAQRVARQEELAIVAERMTVGQPSHMEQYAMLLGMLIAGRDVIHLMPPGMCDPRDPAIQAVLAKSRRSFDANCRVALKQIQLPNIPTADALIAAADRGPVEYAQFIAATTPEALSLIAAGICSACSLPWFRAFIENGADVNRRDHAGSTMLMDMAAQGKIDRVQLLLRHGADVNLRSSVGQTALQIAVQTGQTQIATLLRQHGAAD